MYILHFNSVFFFRMKKSVLISINFTWFHAVAKITYSLVVKLHNIQHSCCCPLSTRKFMPNYLIERRFFFLSLLWIRFVSLISSLSSFSLVVLLRKKTTTIYLVLLLLHSYISQSKFKSRKYVWTIFLYINGEKKVYRMNRYSTYRLLAYYGYIEVLNEKKKRQILWTLVSVHSDFLNKTNDRTADISAIVFAFNKFHRVYMITQNYQFDQI